MYIIKIYDHWQAHGLADTDCHVSCYIARSEEQWQIFVQLISWVLTQKPSHYSQSFRPKQNEYIYIALKMLHIYCNNIH